MTDKDKLEVNTVRSALLRGVTAAVPIVLGYLPIGFAFGVLAQKSGLTATHAILLSLIVFAGSAQLIAVGLFAVQSAPLAVILTTLIVNLRHLLFSAAIFPYVAAWRKGELAGFAFELTDETFAVHATRFEQGKVDKAEAFTINLTAHVAWIIGSGFGVITGHLVAEIESLGLDYVLPAMFIALLVMQIKQHSQLWTAALAGILSVVFLLLGFSQWHVIIATVIGAAFGAWIKGWKTD